MSTNQRFNIIAIFFFQSMFLVKWQMYDFINFCWECICVNKFMMLFLVKVTFILCDDFLSSRLMVTVFTVFILHFVQIKSEKHQTQVPLLCQVIRKHLFPYWHRETQVSKMQFLFCLLLWLTSAALHCGIKYWHYLSWFKQFNIYTYIELIFTVPLLKVVSIYRLTPLTRTANWPMEVQAMSVWSSSRAQIPDRGLLV